MSDARPRQAAFFSTVVPLLACPGCGGEDLSVGDSPVGDARETLRCGTCGIIHPVVGGVPSLFPEPETRVRMWRENLGAFHLQIDRVLALLDEQRRAPGLLPLTEQRLSEQMRITAQVMNEVDGLLIDAIGTPLEPSTDLPGFESRESLRSLHRDWGWTDSDENARALALISRIVKAPLGRTLILGAGACRLAYDLADRDSDAFFVALDDDPLVLLPASRILDGETLSMTEARARATDLGALAATRTLRAPRGRSERVFPLLADGLAPPVKKGTFDTVLTPWFIDIAPPDLRDFLSGLRGLLAPGGRWVNFGPLAYPPERPPNCQFSREELRELSRRAGFTIEAETVELLPCSVSPLDDQSRHERCLAWWATAGDGAPESRGEAPDALPSWLVLSQLSVPDFDGRSFFHHDSAGFRRVFQLIDGRRSIDDIAQALDAPEGTDRGQLRDAIRQCLLEGHPACAPRD